MELERRGVALVAVLALTSIAAGASLAQVPTDRAMLRVIHASPDAPPIDVFVDNVQTFSNVPYTGITPFEPVAAGSHAIRVVRAGTRGPIIFETALDLRTNTYSTVVAVGQAGDVRGLPLLDNNCLPPTDSASIRFVNVSPNATPLDVALGGSPVLFEAPFAVVFSSVPPMGQTTYQTVAAGTYDLEVREAGTNNVILRTPGLVLGGATVYTLYAVGLVGGQPPFQPLLAVDSPSPRR